MRVYIQTPTGAIVDLHVKGGYSPDVYADLVARATALLPIAAAVPVDEPVQR